MTWSQWWESELRRIFAEHYASFSPEQRAEGKRKFESGRPIATGRDTYGMKSHVAYRNNVGKTDTKGGDA